MNQDSNVAQAGAQLEDAAAATREGELKKAFLTAATQAGLAQLDDLFLLLKAKGKIGWEAEGDSFKMFATLRDGSNGSMASLMQEMRANPRWVAQPADAREARSSFMNR